MLGGSSMSGPVPAVLAMTAFVAVIITITLIIVSFY